jgi:hypothetical protein
MAKHLRFLIVQLYNQVISNIKYAANKLMDNFRIISLVIALLVAQFSYAGHYHSADEHHAAAECVLCIHASHLDNAVVNDYLVIFTIPLSGHVDVAGNESVQSSRNTFFDSRAPPLFS